MNVGWAGVTPGDPLTSLAVEVSLPAGLRSALQSTGLVFPTTWHAFRLSTGPVTIQILVSDDETARLVTEELSPPWLSEGLDIAQVTDAELSVFAWRLPGNFRFNLATADSIRTVVGGRSILRCQLGRVAPIFQLDSGTLVAWDPISRTAAIALAESAATAELDARDVVHRQIMQRALQHHGFVVLHGSGIAFGDRAIVIIGDSGAGKTTLQLDLATACQAQLLGGGRTYVSANGQVLPYPGKFTVGADLIANREALRPLLTSTAQILPGNPGKLAVRSADLTRLAGTNLADKAWLSLIVLPEMIEGEQTRPGPRLPSVAVRAELRRQCLTPDPKWPAWLGSYPEPSRGKSLSVLDALADRVPAVRIGIPRASREPSASALRAFVKEWLL